MSFLHKSVPLLGASAVIALTFGAAALIIDAHTTAEAAAKPKDNKPDCAKILSEGDESSTATAYMECLFPYGFNPQIR